MSKVIVRAAVAVALLAGASVSGSGAVRAAAPQTFTVTNTSGSAGVAGSLPWALNKANTNSNGLDVIRFEIPGSGVQRINISSTLYINEQVTIDGTTQPGYAGSPLVYVQGSAATSSLFLAATPSGNTIRGLGMIWYKNNAITLLYGSNANVIADNWIGFTHVGAVTYRNSDYYAYTAAIGVQSSNNQFARNTISGVYNGVVVGEAVEGAWTGRFYEGNSWSYNRIGTNADGTAAIGNSSDGIFFGAGARNSAVGPWNVFGGNASTGVEIFHSSNTGIRVEYNSIGVDPSGTISVPNNELGVLISNGAHGNSVYGNHISGNRLGGVAIEKGAASNWVMNNNIGLNKAQTARLGTQNVGVSVNSGATSNAIRGNVIAGHTQHGVIIADNVSNSVYYNWIGMGGTGVLVANGAFGVMLLRSSYNWISGNAWGTNRMGRIGLDQSYGNNVACPDLAARALRCMVMQSYV